MSGCQHNLGGGTELLSVIIPNFNYARYIERAARSVFEQDYGPIELIVVDDGSIDGSLAAIERAFRAFKDGDHVARTELIAFESNRGKLAALNAAVDVAAGEYVIILDSDDYLAVDYASRCIAVLNEARRSDPQIGFVYTDCKLIDRHDRVIDRGRSTAFDAALVEHLSFLPEPALTLTEALRGAAPFDESIRRATKHHKWRRIVANGWGGQHLAEPLFHYRMHDGNMSGIGRKVLAENDRGSKGERLLSGYWELSREAVAAK